MQDMVRYCGKEGESPARKRAGGLPQKKAQAEKRLRPDELGGQESYFFRMTASSRVILGTQCSSFSSR